MFKQDPEEREGALLRRLKEAQHGGKLGGFGFMTAADGNARRRPMILVARIEHAPRVIDDVQALAHAGADAIEIAVRPGDPIGGIEAAIASVDIPCGVYVAQAGEHDWSALNALEKLDWVHVAAEAPARLLVGKGPTRLISLAPYQPTGRVAGLSGLNADAVVVEGGGVATLTVDTLLAVRAIQGAIKGPVLVGSDLGLVPEDLEVLRDHGVEGVVLAGGASNLKQFLSVLESL